MSEQRVTYADAITVARELGEKYRQESWWRGAAIVKSELFGGYYVELQTADPSAVIDEFISRGVVILPEHYDDTIVSAEKPNPDV